ncbi:sensor histidine kinase [Pseudofrankia saprophytica]|uniref:sensor histidine kinase n=1 Tax=Pseudofrankia saprophytica TaxID=298655 RepID=UPI0018E326F0|nr:sensor histidine kinase [Pseudofrankia saprophytica]
MPHTHDRRLAAAVFALSAVCALATVGGFWCEALEPDAHRPGPLAFAAWGATLPGLALAIAAALLAARLPRHPMTWILAVGGLVACVDGFTAAYAGLSVLRHSGGLPFTAPAVYVGARFGPMTNLVVPLILLFFPDGRLPSKRWRLPAALSMVSTCLTVLVLLTVPWEVMSGGEPRAPGLAGIDLDPTTPALPARYWDFAQPVVGGCLGLSLLVPLAAFGWRFRHCDPQRRAQLRWLLLGGGLSLLLLLVALVTEGWVNDGVFALSVMVVAAAVTVAITRSRLYDVDAVLGWTLLYGAVAATVIALDVAVFVGARAFVDQPVASAAAAGVVAVLYGPMRLRIQRLVTRLLRGRGDPYDVVSALARRLEETSGPDEQLLAVARAVSMAFRSPYVRVELDRADGHTVVAEHGDARSDVIVLPFTYRGASIGRLALVVRRATRLSENDQRLLADMVRQAAAAARATALTEELQRSREHLVTGVAEERRRLRRDLHDGLGPALAGASLKIQAARNIGTHDIGTHDPARADAILGQVSDELDAVLADVRRLVHGLRPPALDQLGLEGAVRQQAARFAGAFAVTVTVDGDLSELPAAVEVSAYRIVGEALANVARHARAHRCAIHLSALRPGLTVEITDDGRGVGADGLVGVGLVAMRERAEELGGSCTVADGVDGGTLVRAVLPCAADDVMAA